MNCTEDTCAIKIEILKPVFVSEVKEGGKGFTTSELLSRPQFGEATAAVPPVLISKRSCSNECPGHQRPRLGRVHDEIRVGVNRILGRIQVSDLNASYMQ